MFNAFIRNDMMSEPYVDLDQRRNQIKFAVSHSMKTGDCYRASTHCTCIYTPFSIADCCLQMALCVNFEYISFFPFLRAI